MTELNFTTKSQILHHGIEGQKWGVQNGPPYPLDSYLSTGKSLRKAARKEAKIGSKEYKDAKQKVKMAKINKNYAKDQYDSVKGKFGIMANIVHPISGSGITYKPSGAHRSTKKILKNQYKDSKMEYKQAKAELNKAKSNTEAAKDILKKVDKMSLDEVQQFLKDRGYTTEAITKLANKDYKKEHRSTITAEKIERKNNLPEVQRNARAKLRNAIATKYEDWDDIPDSLFKNVAKAEISSGTRKNNSKSYKSVDEYINDEYDGDWDYYRSETLELIYR